MLQLDDLKLRAQLWNDVENVVHQFFAGRDYLQVRTPLIVRSPGMEPNLDPVGVSLRPLGTVPQRAGLITSPEYAMKKLLAGGLERIYTLTSVFRDCEKLGQRWGIEFTMLEWYQQRADYTECMRETEALVNLVLDGTENSRVWPRVSYVQEFERAFGYHPAEVTLAELELTASKHGYTLSPGSTSAQAVADLFQWHVMPKLEVEHERFFLIEYPVAEAALAQTTADGRAAQRFEGYVNGLEICNGFTELVNPVEQRARFELEAEERRAAGKEVFPIDEELLNGLASVASPTFGNALGLDRLIMLKAGVKEIDAIHLFPPSLRFRE